MEDLIGTSPSFQESVRLAFAKAKKDILTNLNEINLLKSDIINSNKEIQSLKEKNELLSQLIKKQDELIYLLNQKVENLIQVHPPISSGTSSSGNERVRTTPEELLLRQYKKHKPEIAKRKLLELVPQNGTAQLFNLYIQLVEKDMLCGKTTFYRYVKELSDEQKIEVFLENSQRVVRKKSVAEVMEKAL